MNGLRTILLNNAKALGVDGPVGIRNSLECAEEVIGELQETLQAMVNEQVEYMTINHLGDPEKQHNIKRARAVFARLTGYKEQP
jgi:ribosomal protein L29